MKACFVLSWMISVCPHRLKAANCTLAALEHLYSNKAFNNRYQRRPPAVPLVITYCAVSDWVQHTAAWLKIESKHLQCFISMTRNHALHIKIALNGTVCVSCISNLLTSHALICYMSDSDSWSGVWIDSQWITVVQDTLLWCGLSVLLTVRCSETWSAAWCVTNYFLQIISFCAWTTVPSSSGIRGKKFV